MKNFTKSIIALLCSLLAITAFSQPVLNSYPSATATIYLDFNGQAVSGTLWNGGNPIFCEAATLSDDQIEEIFNRVAEDYRPFEINITTDSTTFLHAPLNKRIRIIITPTSSWKPNVGGVSFTGSFKWGDNTPGFVFSDRLNNNPKSIAECCSHESGHTLGLSHQSKYDATCALVETYNTGIGSGADETSWAPLMGSSYSKNMTGWNDGPTPSGCGNTQDNLSIITGSNGFTYRTDDYTDSLNTSTLNLTSNKFSISGIITTSNDKDAFSFSLDHTKRISFEANPYTIGLRNDGANLDIKLMLYDESKNLIRTYNPEDNMSVIIDTLLTKGIYYIIIDGTGNNNTSNYGSLGAYTFSGTSNKIIIKSLALLGTANLNEHDLHWDMMNPEIANQISIEFSIDGINFTTLNNASIRSKSFNYTPTDNNIKYYRIKAVSMSDEVVYSNVISLKSNEIESKSFKVSTLITNQITVNATENYQYRIMDMNGRMIAFGNGTTGMNNINMYNPTKGMYVIQLFGKNNKQVERIVKQ